MSDEFVENMEEGFGVRMDMDGLRIGNEHSGDSENKRTGCLMDGRVEDIAECSGGEIGDFEYDAGIDLGVVVAEDGCGGGIRGCSNGCSGGCEDDSDIDSLCIEVVAESE
ncbi:Hypothetical predicted protein [Octopus vulgaris]|uniref:Uncharacterized protein n=1 Tax=Octopus vulgaris TaxID=6645 RepID=A0AA36ANB7_OCTVU|nr:Hypothetical predicted protein [Octopus vulgaris]